MERRRAGQSVYIRRSTRLAALHLHQRSAPLDARERVAALASEIRSPDVVALLTCHRVEIYATLPEPADPRAELARRLGTEIDALSGAEVRVGADAAAHLFRVAAGLDSVIVGEAQIASQLRRTFDSARAGGIDPILAALFQRALHLARTVRRTTPLGAVRRSVGSLAVDEALRHVADPLRATVLVVGAGEIGKLAARALARLAARALARRVGHLLIANRDAARAAELASSIEAEAVVLDGLAAALARADVVISAADTRGTLLTRALLGSRAAHGPLVVVDIAMPRSVADDARSVAGLVYRDVDDLAVHTPDVPDAVLADAEDRCASEAASFTAWLRERESAATIRVLRERADAIREAKLARALSHLSHLSERDREVVSSLAASLTAGLLHEPIVRLRRAPEAERAARALFGIER
ncbi:MAG: glutamyl-tRNA reductase [Chloroflexi bacterium]|nr:glutamyl-tRNA reductase [Chloroflexota bacterium]